MRMTHTRVEREEGRTSGGEEDGCVVGGRKNRYEALMKRDSRRDTTTNDNSASLYLPDSEPRVDR